MKLWDVLLPDYSSFILLRSSIFTGSDVTESIYFNVAMGWQVPIHRSPIVSLHLKIQYQIQRGQRSINPFQEGSIREGSSLFCSPGFTAWHTPQALVKVSTSLSSLCHCHLNFSYCLVLVLPTWEECARASALLRRELGKIIWSTLITIPFLYKSSVLTCLYLPISPTSDQLLPFTHLASLWSCLSFTLSTVKQWGMAPTITWFTKCSD